MNKNCCVLDYLFEYRFCAHVNELDGSTAGKNTSIKENFLLAKTQILRSLNSFSAYRQKRVSDGTSKGLVLRQVV